MRKKAVLSIIFVFLAMSVFADGINLSNLSGVDLSTLKNLSGAKNSLKTYYGDSLIYLDTTNLDTTNIMAANSLAVDTTNRFETVIESTYNSNDYNFLSPDSQKLRQFGYDIFKHIAAEEIVARNFSNKDYTIAPGDQITINITGELVKQDILNVDNGGKIFIPNVGDVEVWGKTIKDARKAIRKAVFKKYSNVNVGVSLGNLHNIQVYIIGEVKRPGIYNISAMMSPIQLIYLAGGIKKMGTLRDIKLISNKRYNFDFYKMILHGYRYKGIYLHSGDIVYVPPIGKTVALSGAIKSPGIYEFKNGETLKNLLKYSGGELPFADKKRIQIVTAKGKEKVTKDYTADTYFLLLNKYGKIKLRDGDFISVPVMDNTVYDYVKIDGAVKLPGRYAYKKGMDLNTLLNLAGGVRKGAFLENAFVYRYIDGTRDSIISVGLSDILQNKGKFILADWDSVCVFKEGDIIPNDSVYIYGAVKYPGLYVLKHGKSLKNLIDICGGFNENAFEEGVIFTRKLNTLNRARTDMLISMNQKLLATQAILSNENNTMDEKSKEDLIQYRNDLLKTISGAKDRNRIILNVNDSSDVYINITNGDSIYVPEKSNTVQIIGAVYNPATLMYEKGESIRYYLDKVGGFKGNADKKGMYVLRASGIVDKNTRKIYPGDAIVVPEQFVQRTDWGPIIRDVATIISQLAVAAVSVYSIVKK
ncbi:MAG: hypothetical protein GWP03_02580 [Proteobacteria bacterium]|nr:hypothetical protein [Pseudomonadota bacterium]